MSYCRHTTLDLKCRNAHGHAPPRISPWRATCHHSRQFRGPRRDALVPELGAARHTEAGSTKWHPPRRPNVTVLLPLFACCCRRRRRGCSHSRGPVGGRQSLTDTATFLQCNAPCPSKARQPSLPPSTLFNPPTHTYASECPK